MYARFAGNGTPYSLSMKLVRTIFTSLLTLCLVVCMLAATVTPARAAVSLDLDEVFAKLVTTLGISTDIYNNYATKYGESLPIVYETASDSAYLALGGDTASGYGADGYTDGNYSNSYADKFATHLGLYDEYNNLSSSGLAVADAVNYVNGVGDRKQTVPKAIKEADFITFQIDSSSIITSCVSNMGSTLNWSKYISDPQFPTYIQNLRQDIKEEFTPGYGSNADSIAMVLEYMLYECVAYCFETMNAVQAIRTLNADATILVLGLYNPLRGLTFTANGQTIDIGEIVGEMIDFCNVFLLDRTINMSGVGFVDLSKTTTPGFGNVELNTDDSLALTVRLMEIQKDLVKQHANQAGHNYIYQQLTTSFRAPCNHPGTTIKNAAEASCKDEGYTGDTVCSSCGELMQKGTAIPKTEHQFGAWTQTTPPSCLQGGTETRTCGVCQYPETRPVNALGHSLDNGNLTEAPDCLNEGVKTYRCTNVGCNHTQTTKVPATGHRLDNGTVTQEPDCLSKGEKVYRCLNAGCNHSQTEDIPATGHRLDNGTVTVYPDCVTPGEKLHHCTNADCEYSETQPIPAMGHTLDGGTVTLEPTCISPGVRTHACTKADCDYTESKPIPMTEHTLDSGTITREPTCTTPGVKTYACTGVGCTHTTTESIPTVDHVLDNGTVTTQPTCMVAGVKTYRCTNEGCTHSVTESLGTTDHAMDGGNVTRQPTCMEKGVKTYRCTNAGCTHSTTEDLAKTDHTMDNGTVTKQPSCHAEGVKTYRCTNAGCTHSTTESIAKTEHVMDDGTITLAPTCVTKGVKTYRCTNAGCTHSTTEDVATVDHAMDNGTITRAPTCNAKGVKTYRCTNTGCTHSSTEPLATTDHAWDGGVVTRESGCEGGGIKTITCTTCGEATTETLPAIEHVWDEGATTKEAGCESEGEMTFRCTNDGCDRTKTQAIPATGHAFGDYLVNSDATCQSDGTKTATCSGCGAKDTVPNPYSRLGHIYENKVCIFCNEKEPSNSKATIWWVSSSSFLAGAVASGAGIVFWLYKKKKLF